MTLYSRMITFWLSAWFLMSAGIFTLKARIGALATLAKLRSLMLTSPTPEATTRIFSGRLARMASRDPETSAFITTLNFSLAPSVLAIKSAILVGLLVSEAAVLTV